MCIDWDNFRIRKHVLSKEEECALFNRVKAH
jgi:hypothetical protein